MSSSSSSSKKKNDDDMMEALLKAERQEEYRIGTTDEGGWKEEEKEGELADDEESMTEEDLHDSGIGPLPQPSMETISSKAKRSSISNSSNNYSSYEKFNISFSDNDPLIKTGKTRDASGGSSHHGNGDSALLSSANATTPRIVPTAGGSADHRRHHQRPSLQRQFSEGNLTKISKVERSWFVIADSGKIAQVGERFFLAMFDEYPDLLQLFPFSDDAYDEYGRLKKLNKSVRLHIRAHASAVMRVVGTSVAGLTNIEDLVPRLRAVGATHKTVGVQAFHYDILFRHLVNAIKVSEGEWNGVGFSSYQRTTSMIDGSKK